MTERTSARGLVAGLAIVVHAGFLWMLLRYAPPASHGEPVYMALQVMPIQLPVETPPEPVAPERAVPPPSVHPGRSAEPPPAPAPATEAPASTAITLPAGTGTIDWGREASLAAQSFSTPREEEQRSLDSEPKAMRLPERQGYIPRKGDMSPMKPDGSIGLWTTDEIYCEWREPLMNHFEPWARSIPPHCYKPARKPRPKPSTEFDLP